MKFAEFRLDFFSQNKWSYFVFEKKFANKTDIFFSKYMSKTSYILKFLPKMSQFTHFLGGKIENFGKLTGVKHLTNSMFDHPDHPI